MLISKNLQLLCEYTSSYVHELLAQNSNLPCWQTLTSPFFRRPTFATIEQIAKEVIVSTVNSHFATRDLPPTNLPPQCYQTSSTFRATVHEQKTFSDELTGSETSWWRDD